MKRDITSAYRYYLCAIFLLMVLGCGSKISGKVEDKQTGKPIQSVKIIASMKTNIAEDKKYERQEAISRADGTFLIKGLSPKYSYTIRAEKNDYFSIREAHIRATPPEKGKTKILDRPLKLVKIAPMMGKVINSLTSKPITNAEINANIKYASTESQRYSRQATVSNENGEFDLILFPGAEYNFTLKKSGYKPYNRRIKHSFSSNLLLVKIYPIPKWMNTFGGKGNDFGSVIKETADGGYILLGGNSFESSGKVDIWVIKFDSDGRMQWDNIFGGKEGEWAGNILQTAEGGYILLGGTVSKGAGKGDIWLIKLDTNGKIQWDKTFGGPDGESTGSVQLTSDGGYIIAGGTSSKGSGQMDIWVIKIDSKGKILWDKTFGGRKHDTGTSIRQTADGAYIIAGNTTSKGSGQMDIWVIKIDSKGKILWDKTFGGRKSEWVKSFQLTTDGAYILAGSTSSKGTGKNDAWVIKIDSEGKILWDKTFGGKNNESCNSIQQTTDGGFIFAGSVEKTNRQYDAWIVKLDSKGREVGSDTFGGGIWDCFYDIQQTSTGGFILVGNTDSRATGDYDALVMLLN